jgi:hypothetical protein
VAFKTIGDWAAPGNAPRSSHSPGINAFGNRSRNTKKFFKHWNNEIRTAVLI